MLLQTYIHTFIPIYISTYHYIVILKNCQAYKKNIYKFLSNIREKLSKKLKNIPKFKDAIAIVFVVNFQNFLGGSKLEKSY